jgi:flagellar protein FliS
MSHIDAKEAARLYRERVIEGASPVRILRLLLEGALRRIDRAVTTDARDPASGFVADLQRAEEIVTELRLAIDDSHAPETAARTEAVYDFAATRLGVAITRRDPAPAAEAAAVLRPIHEAWKRIDEGQA